MTTLWKVIAATLAWGMTVLVMLLVEGPVSVLVAMAAGVILGNLGARFVWGRWFNYYHAVMAAEDGAEILRDYARLVAAGGENPVAVAAWRRRALSWYPWGLDEVLTRLRGALHDTRDPEAGFTCRVGEGLWCPGCPDLVKGCRRAEDEEAVC
ncbi:MAG TPA: hypothetical protein GXX28_02095 [Firmicutes bacterium]|nr:hypothetical protein [Bacillota bacterium]